MTDIGGGAFLNINSVSVSPGNKNFTVDKYGAVFDKVNKKLLYVPPSQSFYKIPAGIEIIGCGAFGDNLEKVKIPRSVRVIECFAFQSSRLKKVTLTGKELKIQPFAFKNCKNLKKVFVRTGYHVEYGHESFPAQARWLRINDIYTILIEIIFTAAVLGVIICAAVK